MYNIMLEARIWSRFDELWPKNPLNLKKNIFHLPVYLLKRCIYEVEIVEKVIWPDNTGRLYLFQVQVMLTDLWPVKLFIVKINIEFAMAFHDFGCLRCPLLLNCWNSKNWFQLYINIQKMEMSIFIYINVNHFVPLQ